MRIKRIITVVLSISLLLAGSIFFLIISYGKGNIVYRISDFNLYKNDFQTIADKMLALNDLSNSSDGYIVIVDYEDKQMLCKLNGKNIEMTDKEKSALNNIKNAFHNNSTLLDRITVYKNRVTFCTDGNWYAVAYMIDDSKPKFMSVPTERFNIKVKRIEKNWYHVFSS